MLSLSFDIHADAYEEAERVAIARVKRLAHDLRLSGALMKLGGYTDEGWFESELDNA